MRKLPLLSIMRIAEAVVFLSIMVILGPLVYRYTDSYYLYRVSDVGMAFPTGVSAILSPIYLLASIGVLTFSRRLGGVSLRIALVLPAVLLLATANTLSNWRDPLIIFTTVVLVIASGILNFTWRMPKSSHIDDAV